MRGFTFEFAKASDRDYVGKEFYKAIKDSTAMKLRDVTVITWEKLGLYYLGFMISDCVKGSFSVANINLMGNPNTIKVAFIAIKTDFPEITIELPTDVKVSSEWRADGEGAFKKMVKMVKDGKTRDEIKEYYGSDVSDEDFEKVYQSVVATAKEVDINDLQES